MTLKEGIQNYIVQNGLRAKCDERLITTDDICDYVTDEARKALNGNSGAIDDTTVFKWAVHYIEDEYKAKKQESKQEVVAELKHEPESKHEQEQLTLF